MNMSHSHNNDHIQSLKLPFSVLFWNARGLKSRVRDITFILQSKQNDFVKPKIWCFTESHIAQNITLPNVTNFQWIHQSHTNNSGGLSMLIHNSVPHEQDLSIPKYRPFNEQDSTSIMFVTLNPPQQHRFVLALVYIQPNANSNSVKRVCKCIRNVLLSRSEPVIIVGDFNLKHPDWMSSIRQPTAAATRLSDFIEQHNLTILNNAFLENESTREQWFTIPSGQQVLNKSTIDLALTSIPESVQSVYFAKEYEHLLKSDHRPIILHVTTFDNEPPAATNDQPRIAWRIREQPEIWQQELPKLCDKSFESFEFNVADQRPNSPEQAQQTINSLMEQFEVRLMKVCQECIGVKINVKGAKHWFGNHEVKVAHEQLRYWHCRAKRNKFEPNIKQFYQKAQQEWKQAKQNAINESWSELCCSLQHDITASIKWSAFKQSVPHAFVPLSSFRNEHGELPSSPKESLDNLTEAFVNSAIPPVAPRNLVREFENLVSQRTQSPILDDLDNWNITIEEVKEQCCQQRLTSAPGPDNILPHFLVHGGEMIHRALATMFNFSWKYSVLADGWRSANVMALYKGKGSRNEHSSFRPISMTSVVIRVFEHLIQRKLSKRLEDNNFFHDLQFGFRQQHGTIDAIHYLLSHIRSFVVKGRQVPVAFLDLTKAFDRVWPERLLTMLDNANIHGKAWAWLKAFITQRHIRVIDKTQSANWHNIHFGVPQGAVLSPLLFLIFVNEIARNIHRKCPMIKVILYADDMVITPVMPHRLSDNRWQTQFQKALDMLSTWSKEARMIFSNSKSAIVVFHRTKQLPDPIKFCFEIGDFELQLRNEYEYLGVWLQQQLRWNIHNAKLVKLAKQNVYLINRMVKPQNPPYFSAIRALTIGVMRARLTYAIELIRSDDRTLRRIQAALVRPTQKSLSLPFSSTHHVGTLVEMNCSSIVAYRERKIINFFDRALKLPTNHPTKNVIQMDMTARTNKRLNMYTTSFAIEAMIKKKKWLQNVPSFSKSNPKTDFKLPQTLPPNLLKPLTIIESKRAELYRTHLEWKHDNQHHSTAPILTLNLKPEPIRTHFLYLESDLSIVSTRAKLRHNRFRTEQFVQRFVNFHHSSLCRHQQCTQQHHVESIEHLVTQCPRHHHSRQMLENELRLLQLDNPPPLMSVVLGHISNKQKLNKSEKQKAKKMLKAGANFIKRMIAERQQHATMITFVQ